MTYTLQHYIKVAVRSPVQWGISLFSARCILVELSLYLLCLSFIEFQGQHPETSYPLDHGMQSVRNLQYRWYEGLLGASGDVANGSSIL